MSGDQLQMFSFCPGCGGERVYLPHQVAPVEVWRLPDGRVLVNFWNGLRGAVWVELSEEGRFWLAGELLQSYGLRGMVWEELSVECKRWLAGELFKGLDAATGSASETLPVQSTPEPTHHEGVTSTTLV